MAQAAAEERIVFKTVQKFCKAALVRIIFKEAGPVKGGGTMQCNIHMNTPRIIGIYLLLYHKKQEITIKAL